MCLANKAQCVNLAVCGDALIKSPHWYSTALWGQTNWSIVQQTERQRREWEKEPGRTNGWCDSRANKRERARIREQRIFRKRCWSSEIECEEAGTWMKQKAGFRSLNYNWNKSTAKLFCTRCTYLVALALQRLQLPHTSLFLHRSTTPVIVIQRQPLFDWAFGLFLTLSPHGQTSVTLHWGCSASVYTINTAAVNPHSQPSSLSRLSSGHTGRIWLLVLESLAGIVTGAEGFSSTLFRLV